MKRNHINNLVHCKCKLKIGNEKRTDFNRIENTQIFSNSHSLDTPLNGPLTKQKFMKGKWIIGIGSDFVPRESGIYLHGTTFAMIILWREKALEIAFRKHLLVYSKFKFSRHLHHVIRIRIRIWSKLVNFRVEFLSF